MEKGIEVGWDVVFKESWDPGKAVTQQCQDLLPDAIYTTTDASGSPGLVRAVLAIWGTVEI